MGASSLNSSGSKAFSLNSTGAHAYTLNSSGQHALQEGIPAVTLGFADAVAEGFSLAVTHPELVTLGFADATAEGFALVVTHPEQITLGLADATAEGFAITVTEGVSETLLNDLIVWYTGEDANDSHTGSHDLTAVNSPTHITGKIGDAFQPAITGNKFWRISSATFPDLGTSDFTIAFWTQGKVAGGNDGLLEWGYASGTNKGVEIWSNTEDKIIVYFSDDTTRIGKQFIAALSSGVWAHLVFVFDRSGNLSLYKDKVLVSTVDISAIELSDLSITADFTIGSTTGAGKNDAPMDELAMWRRALTTDEIDRLFDDELTYSDL